MLSVRILEGIFLGFNIVTFFFLDHPEIQGEVARKNDKLLSLLKDVYVDSRDPVSSVQVMCVLIQQMSN